MDINGNYVNYFGLLHDEGVHCVRWSQQLGMFVP